MRDLRGYLKRHRTGSVFLLLVIVCISLMALTTEADIVAPQRVGNAAFSLIQRGFSEVGSFFKRFFTSIGELSQLRGRYNDLQEQLIQYRRDERELIRLRQENDRLKNLLELSDNLGYEHVAAEVIANDPSSFFNALVIDKGRFHGIETDMPVVAYQDGFQGLVGKVVAVGPVSSQVLPLFDASCYVPARLQNMRYTGLIRGMGSRFSHLEMTYVPKSARDLISVGDLIATSGLSTIYPKEIYIGRIRGISAKTWEASLTLEIETIIDFSRIEYVFVLNVGEGETK